MDKVIDVPVALQAGFNSADRPQTVEIHAVQFVDAEVNISVNMLRQVPTERKARRSCSDTALNDVQTSSIHRSRKFTRHSSERRQTPPNHHAKTGSEDPEGAVKQVFGPKMNKAEAQLNRACNQRRHRQL